MEHKFYMGQKVKCIWSVENGVVIGISFSIHRPKPIYQIQYTTHEGYLKDDWFYESDLELVV